MYSEKNKKEVLDFLKGGYKLNALVAHREFGHIGSTLAGIVRELRLDGWDINTKLKKGPKSGRKYAEYTLNPNWRLIGEELKRAKLQEQKNKKISILSIRNLKIGDYVYLSNEVEVYLTALSLTALTGRDDKGNSYLFELEDISYKTNKINREVA